MSKPRFTLFILAIATSTVAAILLLVALTGGYGPTVGFNASIVAAGVLWTAYLVLGASEDVARRLDRDQAIRRIRTVEDTITTGSMRRSGIRPVD